MSPTCTHVCVFTCAHMCVLIRHVYVFRVNTCLFSDEHSCVCVPRVHVCAHVCVCVFQFNTCLRSRRTRGCYRMSAMVCVCVCSGCTFMLVFTCAHMCVHVHTYVSSTCTHMCVLLGHVFVFQVDRCVFHANTLLCARWIVFASDDILALQVCTCMCSRKRMIVFEVRTCVCVCASFRRSFMFAHACTNVCSTCAHMWASIAHVVFLDTYL